jgi:hypothetical protein
MAARVVMTCKQYAKARGISQPVMSRQLRRVGINPSDGPFDPADADRRLKASRSAYVAKNPSGVNKSARAMPAKRSRSRKANERLTPLTDKSTIADAQRHKEISRARQEQLKYDRMQGALVEREVVNREAFNLGRQIRDALLAVPDRLAGILVSQVRSEPDDHKAQHVVHEMLTKEFRQALEAVQ